MLEHITDLLIRKGYGLLDEDTEGILYRESKDCIWAVTLSFASKEDDTNAYIAIQRKIEFNLSTKFGKKVQCLHIVLAENGMFQGSEQYLIHKLSNVWLIARIPEDYTFLISNRLILITCGTKWNRFYVIV